VTEATLATRDGLTGQISFGPRTKKLSPAEAGFRVAGGVPGLQCGDCRYFVGGDCFIVEVHPNPGDYCDEFTPALHVGNIPSPSQQTLAVMSDPAHATMFISRVSKDRHTGARRWFATSSGIKTDAYGERMSVELFQDFIRRIDSRESVPTPFASEAWQGGNPYLGVAHYLDLDGYGIVGPANKVYIDSTILKARGEFRDTPLAVSAYDAIERDIKENRPPDDRIRISIAFIDWGHEHAGHGMFERKSLTDHCPMCEAGLAGKVYRKGHLVHLALTRKPAYPETEIGLEERSSMQTKRDDAASIVGDKEADELERRAKPLQLRSEGLVIKSEEAPTPAPAGTDAPPPVGYLGGALTLAEAEAFMQKSGAPILINEWGVLAGILSNISASPSVENKPLAIRSVISDFQANLDVQTARVLSDIAPLLARGANIMEDKPEVDPSAPPETGADVPAPAPSETAGVEAAVVREAPPPPEAAPAAPAAPAPAPPPAAHPLDESLGAFKAAFDQATAAQVSPEEKLAMIQPALDALADTIIRIVAGPVAGEQPTQPAEAPAPAAAGTMMAASLTAEAIEGVVDNRMAQHLAPLRSAVDEIKASQAEIVKALTTQPERRPPLKPSVLRVAPPERPKARAIQLIPRSLNTGLPGLPLSIGATPRRATGLKALVRRSVGIHEE